MNRKAKALEFADAEYRINVTGRHIEVTDAMRQEITEKIFKLERFIGRIIDVNVILDIQKLDHQVEIVLKAGQVKITSRASTTDLYASIDQAFAKLESQIRRYKSKLQDHHVKNRPVTEMKVSVIAPSEDEESFEEGWLEDESGPTPKHRIVSQETRPLTTLTDDEALLRMELSGDSFLIFRGETDQKVKIIYRRKDGQYGVIEPTCSSS